MSFANVTCGCTFGAWPARRAGENRTPDTAIPDSASNAAGEVVRPVVRCTGMTRSPRAKGPALRRSLGPGHDRIEAILHAIRTRRPVYTCGIAMKRLLVAAAAAWLSSLGLFAQSPQV